SRFRLGLPESIFNGLDSEPFHMTFSTIKPLPSAQQSYFGKSTGGIPMPRRILLLENALLPSSQGCAIPSLPFDKLGTNHALFFACRARLDLCKAESGIQLPAPPCP